MPGVKGRSGRLPRRAEIYRNVSIETAIRVINHVIADKSIPEIERAKLIMPYVLKTMPDRVEQINYNLAIDSDLVRRTLDFAERNNIPTSDNTDPKCITVNADSVETSTD